MLRINNCFMLVFCYGELCRVKTYKFKSFQLIQHLFGKENESLNKFIDVNVLSRPVLNSSGIQPNVCVWEFSRDHTREVLKRLSFLRFPVRG